MGCEAHCVATGVAVLDCCNVHGQESKKGKIETL